MTELGSEDARGSEAALATKAAPRLAGGATSPENEDDCHSDEGPASEGFAMGTEGMIAPKDDAVGESLRGCATLVTSRMAYLVIGQMCIIWVCWLVNPRQFL